MKDEDPSMESSLAKSLMDAVDKMRREDGEKLWHVRLAARHLSDGLSISSKLAEYCVEKGDGYVDALFDYAKTLGSVTQVWGQASRLSECIKKLTPYMGVGAAMNMGYKRLVKLFAEKNMTEDEVWIETTLSLMAYSNGENCREWVGEVLKRCPDKGVEFMWRQMTNVNGYLKDTLPEVVDGFLDAGLDVSLVNSHGNKPLRSFLLMLKNREEISSDEEMAKEEALILRMADLGNGLSDSKWVEVEPEVEFKRVGHENCFRVLKDKEALNEAAKIGKAKNRVKI